MNKIFTITLLCVLGLCHFTALSAQLPKDNPYFAKYDSCPIWMDELKWTNVVNVLDFAVPGQQSWDSAVGLAIEQVSQVGGGVVYFPAGEYVFMNDLEVLDGVVLRGETPVNKVAIEDNFAPPTRLVFPKYEPVFVGNGTPNNTAFKRIYAFGDKSNIGLVYLDINRGRIHFSVSGKNLMILGVRQNNVAEPQGDIPGNFAMMPRWQRFAFRHGRNVRANASRNISVANCRINDFENNTVHPIPDESYDQPGAVLYGHYTGSDLDAPTGASFNSSLVNEDGEQIDTTHIRHAHWYRFSYTDHYAIGVGAPKINPANLEKEIDQKVEVIDNWVYNTMRVGIFAQGIGLRIAGNVRRDESGKRNYVHATGSRVQTNNAATLENRALNFAGNDIVIENNDLEVYRHNILHNSYYSVDGEGILIQTQDIWGAHMDKVYIRNNKVNAYIGIYDMKHEIRNLHITGNDLMNSGSIFVFKKEIDYRMDDIFIEDNYNVTFITMGWKFSNNEYRALGTNFTIKNNKGSGTLNYPCQAVVSGNTGFTDNMTTCDGLFLLQRATPYQGQLDVRSDHAVTATFNEDLQSASSALVSFKDSQGANVPFMPNVNGNTLEINHTGLTKPNETYTVVMQQNAVQSTMGQNSEAATWWFRTMPRPYAVATFPSANAQYMDVNTAIIAEFNQDVTLLNPSLVSLTDVDSGRLVPVSAVYDPLQRQLSLNHDGLAENAWYRVMILDEVLQNEAGFRNDTLQWDFYTGDKEKFSTGIPVQSVNAATELSLYPVPAGDVLNVRSSDPISSYTIVSLSGKVLVNRSLANQKELQIALQNISSGMYMLVLQTNNAKVSRIIVKE